MLEWKYMKDKYKTKQKKEEERIKRQEKEEAVTKVRQKHEKRVWPVENN